MSNKLLCKGECGNIATYKGWCRTKWISGNKFCVSCPIIEKNRGKAISKYRIKEAKLGKNPMQNPEICAKNHSPKRNKNVANTLHNLGKLGLLPQQIESKRLKNKRRKNVSKALAKLWEEGKHPRQLETIDERKKRLSKVSRTLTQRIKDGIVETPWPIKNVKYKGIRMRSNWEKIIAKLLEKKGFIWKYENLVISYFDTERDREANTIPDFYLPEINTIIEVKGRWIESQRTKDKIYAIKNQGFNVILIGEKEMDMLKKDPNLISNLIRGIK